MVTDTILVHAEDKTGDPHKYIINVLEHKYIINSSCVCCAVIA